MEGKHEEFWNQGDFGYVKKELDTMMTLCKPIAKVRTLFIEYKINYSAYISSITLFPRVIQCSSAPLISDTVGLGIFTLTFVDLKKPHKVKEDTRGAAGNILCSCLQRNVFIC